LRYCLDQEWGSNAFTQQRRYIQQLAHISKLKSYIALVSIAYAIG